LKSHFYLAYRLIFKYFLFASRHLEFSTSCSVVQYGRQYHWTAWSKSLVWPMAVGTSFHLVCKLRYKFLSILNTIFRFGRTVLSLVRLGLRVQLVGISGISFISCLQADLYVFPVYRRHLGLSTSGSVIQCCQKFLWIIRCISNHMCSRWNCVALSSVSSNINTALAAPILHFVAVLVIYQQHIIHKMKVNCGLKTM
jgi:hypothetical protein